MPDPEHVCRPGAAVYYCPTSGSTESDCHGAHDVCCDRPDLHRTLDPQRRYLVPVARVNLPEEPDVVHLALYQWLDSFEAWATGRALCGHSTAQGALSETTEVTCPRCLEYRTDYERYIAPGYDPADDDPKALRARIAGLESAAAGAWGSVWLHGNWRYLTGQMTTEEREHAADAVVRWQAGLTAMDGVERTEPDGLRWWREAGQ
ncbi:hypothetical protein [Streptomyces sp. NBC_01353]|uniref:hypothetical protein n=1 Tax=Streptomyces sp. NBC_01353 TaxID=2903835 RepID=UPI002E34BE14|nr:hypothetical protein [Streptomyces sp. NBC_01353]